MHPVHIWIYSDSFRKKCIRSALRYGPWFFCSFYKKAGNNYGTKVLKIEKDLCNFGCIIHKPDAVKNPSTRRIKKKDLIKALLDLFQAEPSRLFTYKQLSNILGLTKQSAKVLVSE